MIKKAFQEKFAEFFASGKLWLLSFGIYYVIIEQICLNLGVKTV